MLLLLLTMLLLLLTTLALQQLCTPASANHARLCVTAGGTH